MYYLVITCTQHNTVDILNLNELMTDFSSDNLKSFENYSLGYGVVDRPRGIKVLPGTQGAFAVAAFDTFSQFDFDPTKPRLNEYFARTGGYNNHDIVTINGDLRVLATGVGTTNAPEDSLVKDSAPTTESAKELTKDELRALKRGEKLPMPEVVELVNTVTMNEKGNIIAYTLLTPRNPIMKDRPTNKDAVVLAGVKHYFPGADTSLDDYGWHSPHHLTESLNGEWWVCNSGTKEIVNLTVGEVFNVGGFPRGLVAVPHPEDARPCLLFTKSVHRDENETEGYIGLLDVDANSGTYGDVLATLQLPYRPAPYALGILDIQ